MKNELFAFNFYRCLVENSKKEIENYWQYFTPAVINQLSKKQLLINFLRALISI